MKPTKIQKKSFLSKLFYFEKKINTNNGNPETVFKLFGITLVKRVATDSQSIYYLLNKEILKKDLANDFKKRYIKLISEKYDDIYILRANSGEIYLTLTYIIDALIKKNNSKKPLLIATQKYHIDLIKMLTPDIPYLYIKRPKIKCKGTFFTINKQRFFLLYDYTHFKRVELDILDNTNKECHYFKSMMNKFGICESELLMRNVEIIPSVKDSMLNKVSQLNLNLNNFIFLAPEAKTCKPYNIAFWTNLITGLQKKGYDIFINLTNDEQSLRNIPNLKFCYLTFAEAFALAQKAKKIITLRSGFTEFLLQTNVPMSILYTDFKACSASYQMDSSHVLRGFGLSKIPFINMNIINELNTFEVSAKDCLDIILNDI